ncbi:MAG: helix-turn-helix domain-containing protein [Firmicutes bacterium]|nr:helix-turn-helix domain-containing protein [Bacillota bacterium]
MSIGSKIRELRRQRGLTQKELAGDEITRNMLSLIENDLAKPSLETLVYISERLDVSPAYLLDESERTPSEIESMLCSLYNEGDFESCIRSGGSLSALDAGGFLAHCYLNLAAKRYLSRDFSGAREALLFAKDESERSADITDTVYNMTLRILCLPELREKDDGESVSELLPAERLMADDFYMFLLSLATASTGEETESVVLYGLHISAREMMSSGDYDGAVKALTLAEGKITGDTKPALSYMIYDDLETCAAATGDYKLAYEASTKKRIPAAEKK